jgi:beta-lactam-binding protein with PASTA domain
LELKEKIISKLLDKNFYIQSISIFLGLILLVLVMDWIVMPLYTKHGRDFELPDVTDCQLANAVEILEDEGFDPIIQDSIYDEHFSPGKVVQQNPLPFSRVKKGRRIYLIVSAGERPREVPALIGLTPQDAEFRLKEAGLKLNEKIVDFSEFYPRGVVINQSIPPGEIVEKDQLINITISLGPAPSSLEVPNLVGKSLESARKELDVVGLMIGRIRTVYRPNLVPGTILMQSVPPGQKVTLVDSVSLIVSTDQPIGSE